MLTVWIYVRGTGNGSSCVDIYVCVTGDTSSCVDIYTLGEVIIVTVWIYVRGTGDGIVVIGLIFMCAYIGQVIDLFICRILIDMRYNITGISYLHHH